MIGEEEHEDDTRERRDSRGCLHAPSADHRPSIELALKIAGEGKSGRGVRLLFPIDPEAFFLPVAPTRERPPEMDRVGIYGVDEAIPLLRETEPRVWRTQIVSQGEKAPGILTRYLGPFSGSKLLSEEEESDLGRRTRTEDACPDASDRSVNRELVRQSQYNPERRLRRRLVSERCRRDTSWQRIGDHGGRCYEGLTNQGL